MDEEEKRKDKNGYLWSKFHEGSVKEEKIFLNLLTAPLNVIRRET